MSTWSKRWQISLALFGGSCHFWLLRFSGRSASGMQSEGHQHGQRFKRALRASHTLKAVS
eukprot:2126196-Alexandrium_andersonii.AAC.1